MAKSLTFNRFLFLLFCSCIFSVPAISQNGSPVNVDVKADAIRVQYRKMVGIKEATGNNDGKEVEKILATVGLGKGFPWCAAAVKYGLLNAGIVSAKQINGMALSCENKKAFVYKSRTWLQQLIHGDVFTIYYARLKRIGHTGFVDKIANKQYGTVVTYEGNTNSGGSRDGDGFYVRIRQIASLHSISRWR
jgi:hypothetical protein